MAKKRAAPKRRVSRKKKRPDLTRQLLKIIGALSVLVLLLVGAGLLAHYALRPTPQPPPIVRAPKSIPPPRRSAPTPPPKKPAPAAKGERARKPTYEVFRGDPVPKPVNPVAPLPHRQLPPAAIIIDDIGYDRLLAEQLLALEAPLTFALLPHAPFGREMMKRALAAGREIMLHLPMEPNEYPDVDPGPGALLASMSPDRLIAALEDNLNQFEGLRGVNNHMGSRLSASPEHMRQIFSVLKRRGLYYIDSRTTTATVAPMSARLFQVPLAERDVFIDHHDDPQFIRSQLKLFVKRAKKQGYAVAIGHPHRNTYQALKEMLPEIQRELDLLPASRVVQTVSDLQAQKAAPTGGAIN